MATNKVMKWATHGAVSAGVYQMLNPGQKSIRLALLNGQEVPLWAVSAAMGVGASIASDMASAWILPQIADGKRLQKLEGAVVALGAGGASFVAAGYVANPSLINDDGQMKQLFITGAVAELASQWVYDNLISVYMY